MVYEFQNSTIPALLVIGQSDRTAIRKDLASKEVKKTGVIILHLEKQ